MLGQRVDSPASTFGLPYRSSYYGVGICLKGRATVDADLETHSIGPRSVLAMPPQAIKQWRHVSQDFEHIAVFFTRAFITARTAFDPDRFHFFDSGRCVLPLAPGPARVIGASLRQLQRRYSRSHPYRDEILRASINILLYDLEVLAQLQRPVAGSTPNRGRQLSGEFKRLVRRHCTAERTPAFYARALSITPRHLSATLHEQTGKTAGRWIQEAVVLEASVLLQNAALTIAQVADGLHFADQSSFGKYFKHVAGLSPLAYRRGLPANPTF